MADQFLQRDADSACNSTGKNQLQASIVVVKTLICHGVAMVEESARVLGSKGVSEICPA
ncbi:MULTISPECIES: hypothetical protein [unclassified Synechococcus]|uniref:hypothetical protein n=1 Tax=unclassified Synechococcus TaxID=2626047 RepID=UPI0021A75C41|nr:MULTISPECIES: hypothetical protein [unclassified Synechococcus]MCT0212323.1 hypothetical protein [Synechococcus sp. CS-1326]MCT0234264.1 hypothetical protein [Synechococcus sp. CS-1327]